MSVMPESVENLAAASLQPDLPVNESEGKLVVVGNSPHPPPRRGSSLEPEREVIPNNNETDEEFVFRILGNKILELAILDGPVGRSSPSRELALCYRLVCRDWRDTINSIYHTTALPLFKYTIPIDIKNLVQVEQTMRNLNSLTSLFAPPADSGACSGVVPPLSLELSGSFLSIPLETKIEFEAITLNSLRQLGRMLLTLKLELFRNPLEARDCCSLDLPNLKHAEFDFSDDYDSTLDNSRASWKIIEAIVAAAPSLRTLILNNSVSFERAFSAEMPELVLSKSIEKLELRCIRIPMWLVDIAPTLKNMRSLVLHIEKEPACPMENRLINKLSKYLEILELNEDWPLSSLSEVTKLSEPTISILEPMPKLRTLKLSISYWKLGELRSYKELLPSLTDLEVHLLVVSSHVRFPASWYASPCLTLRRLSLSIYRGTLEASLFSQQVLGGISQCFPNLHELEVTSIFGVDDSWQNILCQGFPNLRKLQMRCYRVTSAGRNRLVSAVTGIPLEELHAIWEGEKELEEVIHNYQHCRSLRDLPFLEELELNANGYDRGRHFIETDSTVMILSSFLRMPNLKEVVLSRMFRLTDELKQHARNETGLDIYHNY